jgi:phage-related protein
MLGFNSFEYNGIDLRSYGMYLKKRSLYTMPSRNLKLYGIAGRSGRIPVGGDVFDNVNETYEFWSYAREMPYTDEETIKKLIDWLFTDNAYKVLRDTYHEGYYTKAICTKVTDVKIKADGMVQGKITFSRLPYWYLETGKEPLVFTEITNNEVFTTLINPEKYNAIPDIEISANNPYAVTLYVNNRKYEIASMPSGTSTAKIEGETGNLYINGVLKNSSALYDYIPELPAETEISLKVKSNATASYSGWQYVKITPNWRRI